MKQFLKIIGIVVLLSLFIPVISEGSSSESWFLVKRKGECPGFPKSTAYLDKHSCYYLDKSANESGDKVLYLTFDAGYENGNVERILDTLLEENAPAAFFLLSNIVVKNSDLVSRMFNEGHSVCNHTKNHKNLANLTDAEIKANLSALEELCQSATGGRMLPYFRFPEGVYSERTVSVVESLGYKTFFWSVAYADWDNSRQPSEESAMESLLNQTHPGAVILLHPTSDTNARILGKMIRAWRDMGYRFGTLDELVANN